jgi:imidazolonepropionase-like amidohydrolase
MLSARISRALLLTALAAVVLPCGWLIAQTPEPITIRAGRLLDGRGGSARNVVIQVDGHTITSVGPRGGKVTYDLSNMTATPGWIDTHVHIGWHFGKDGRFDNAGETPIEQALAGAGNAYLTLMGGFTTVQSLGAASDVELSCA